MTNKHLIVAIFILLVSAAKTNAQSLNPVLLQVADEKVTKNEFLKIFNKNNINNEPTDQKALEEYLDLFINFRLKVAEAKNLGMDTARAFTDELEGYRRQLAAPYLIDKEAGDKIVQEAYDRKRYDVHASHILVKVEKLASAADTLAAWNKVMKLRKRILKGEDFGKVAIEASDDPSARDRVIDGRKVKGNKGDLGFFTVFDMVYPFESAAYNAQLNEVTLPVRTDYGYHLIKLLDKSPAMGKVQLAHIMLVYPAKATLDDSLRVADSANLAYEQLQKGAEFADVAKVFSDDQSTSAKGGILPWFGISRLLPEFVVNIQKLQQIGDYSEPFQTPYGWHIIKLIDRKPVLSFDEEKEEISQRVSRSDRSENIANSFVNKTKALYGFSENTAALDQLTHFVNDSIFKGTWQPDSALMLKNTLFAIGQRSYGQNEFAATLANSQRLGSKADIQAYVKEQYSQFVNACVNKYADQQLENRYPDFKELINEYHDGILLFDLTDKKVWTKAVSDSIGLQKYYDVNKNNYLWDQRLDASVFTVKDPSVLKALKKMMRKKASEDAILAKFTQDTIRKVLIDHKLFLKGDNALIDKIEWKTGKVDIPAGPGADKQFVIVHRLVAPEPKPLNEIRGLITADYQNFLEKEWISELRAKYPVKVDKDVLQSLLQN